MIELESKIAETMRFDADQAIKLDGLHDGAVARAGTIRRRQRALATVVAAGLAALTTAGVVSGPRLAAPEVQSNLARPVTDTEQGPAAPVGPAGPTTLPEVVGVPTAGQRPAVVGSDPWLLHFDVNVAAVDGTTSAWTAGKGYEKVTIGLKSKDPNRRIEVILTTNPKVIKGVMVRPGWMQERPDGNLVGADVGTEVPTTVNGRPAKIGKISVDYLPETTSDNSFSWVLTWQPVDGLYAQAQVFQADKALAYKAAQALRLDRAQRCVMPMRFAAVPTGVSTLECSIEVRRRPVANRSGVFVSSGVLLEYPDRHQVSVWFEDDRIPEHPHDAGWFQPNRTVAGKPAMWMIRGEKGLAVDYGGVSAGVWPGRRANRQDDAGLTEAGAVSLMEDVRITGNLAKTDTWPQRAIG